MTDCLSNRLVNQSQSKDPHQLHLIDTYAVLNLLAALTDGDYMLSGVLSFTLSVGLIVSKFGDAQKTSQRLNRGNDKSEPIKPVGSPETTGMPDR